MTGVALLASAGWLLERRRRLARQAAKVADIVAADAAPANASSFDLPQDAAETPGAWQVDPSSAAVRVVELPAAAWQPEVAETALPQKPDWQPHRASMLGVDGQKRLIKGLMWMRAVAGGAAILAAIAIVVFWSIETTDRRAGETGLNMLLLLLAGWAASWGAGQLANMLHRWFFGRVHPKFDN